MGMTNLSQGVRTRVYEPPWLLCRLPCVHGLGHIRSAAILFLEPVTVEPARCAAQGSLEPITVEPAHCAAIPFLEPITVCIFFCFLDILLTMS